MVLITDLNYSAEGDTRRVLGNSKDLIRLHLFGQPLLYMSKLGDVYDADETEDQVFAGEGADASSTPSRLCRRLWYH